MAMERVERRLTAILAADVAGYSRLTSMDEEGTHVRLKEHLRLLVEPKISEHRGHVVKNTGDGMLAEFNSVVAAVRCALDVQRGMAERNAGIPRDKRMEFRIGINVGDVIIDGGDIFGDGVNVAVRLEGIAEPGGICVSARVQEYAQGRVDITFEDAGEQRLKNISQPVRAYRLNVRDVDPLASALSTEALSQPDRPRLSIVVLPFANLGGDVQQDDFVDAITDNLTTDLSRLPDYFVISCKTAFAYKGKAVDARQIGRELGVRYVLEGSIQSSTDRLRVNAQLIDAESGAHFWAERFDKPRADLFDMQDEITARLARAMDIQLVKAETQRLKRETPRELDSVDLALRGWTVFFQKVSVAGAREARGMFEEALRVDHTNVDALMGLVESHMWEVNSYMSPARDDQVRLGEAAMCKASELTPLDARMHFCRAAVLIALRAPERAFREIEIALSLDRALPYVHMRAGWIKIFLGCAEEAEGHLSNAMRLSPRDPMLGNWYAILGLADLHLGRLDKAVDRLQKAVEIAPNHEIPYFYLAASLALQGREAEAAQACKVGRRLAPIFRIGKCRAEVQSDNPVFLLQRERVYEGLEKAGLPE
ncbi:adenylate/guanylate cyclase domain-containing protein [Bradyrhizobium sp. ISRA464]|uniref:adenylate/guanylate cyclase domain-containing protein n=1 Tax=Bradyrhizobium sp. ISRA464 TaxID=2866200 RepID=UPI0024799D60|nr:adenylate/guanylate cyclase domain-containing protein [Bradyrhizobium sp. ISRA464]WGS27189.1 adenylate/guanylate cyclase domain-containing protein [Bradyrhizobium sp. ISRA464]